MINIFMCDADTAALAKYQMLLKAAAEKEQYQVRIKTFRSTDQLLFKLLEEPDLADLILLDIKIGKVSGIETAKKLRSVKCRAEIIFITTQKEHVFDSFEVEPFYYIMKQEVSIQKFEKIAISVFRKILNKKRDFLVCRTAALQRSIPIQSITHFSIIGRVTTVYYGHEKFEFYATIKELEARLQYSGFIKCHRAYIVNLSFIDIINLTEIILKNGVIVPVGRTFLSSLKIRVSDFFLESFST